MAMCAVIKSSQNTKIAPGLSFNFYFNKDILFSFFLKQHRLERIIPLKPFQLRSKSELFIIIKNNNNTLFKWKLYVV